MLGKRVLAAGFVFAVAGGVVASVPQASAGSGGCQLGYACLWKDNDYNGSVWAKHYDGPLPGVLNNEANSAVANGNSCKKTRFYDYAGGKSGSYFVLYSQIRVRENYRDPNLSNGAGRDANFNQNWEDRVSYISFEDCDSR